MIVLTEQIARIDAQQNRNEKDDDPGTSSDGDTPTAATATGGADGTGINTCVVLEIHDAPSQTANQQMTPAMTSAAGMMMANRCHHRFSNQICVRTPMMRPRTPRATTEHQ